MDKKTYIQISLITLILFIISYVYFDYFKSSEEKSFKNLSDNSEKKIVKESEDLITKMSYFSEDNKGNRYEIFSEYGVISPEKLNLIFMDKVKAFVYLSNGEKILISSNKAKYNDNNNDTTFSGSVEMIYEEHSVKSDFLDLSFNNQTALLYDNVRYKNNLSKLNADKILVDFLNKNTKIQMNDDKSNVFVKSVVSNGNN